MSLVLRGVKGSPLTYVEADGNFSGLADGSLIPGGTAGLASPLDGLGDALIRVKLPVTGGVDRTQHDKNMDIVSVFDFMTTAEIADVRARTELVNVDAAIQNGINYVISIGGALYKPSGTYKLAASLLVYLASTFITCSIYGEEVSTRNDKGVIISHAALTTTPALVIQGGRSVSVSNIQFIGPNVCTPATWFTASEWTVGGVRDQIDSPQCAIAVDPFATGGAPAGSGGYPGYASYYASTALASSATTFRNIRFLYQVVGLFNGNLVSHNNENNIYENLTFATCKTGLSFGQIQSKGCVLKNINADLCYTVLDTYTYSDRNGSAGFLWMGGDISRCHSMIRTLSQIGAANSVTQNWLIQGVYAEGLWTIGWIGDASGFAYIPGEFQGCTFWFQDSLTQCVDAHLVNFAPLKFTTCKIWRTFVSNGQIGRTLKFYHESKSVSGQKSYLTFENDRFMSASFPLFPNAALVDVEMVRSTNHSATGTQAFKGTFSSRVKVSQLNDITNQAAIWPGALIENKDTGALIYVKQGMNTVSLGSLAVTVDGVGGATFTAADSTTVQVNDIIYATNQLLTKIDDTTFTAATWPFGRVASMIGADITLDGVGKNAASGMIALSVNWYSRMHPPSTIVTHTSTTAEISFTGNGTAWAAGDRVIASDLTAGTYIVSGTSPNFVLSKAATGSAASHRCYDADANTITQVAL